MKSAISSYFDSAKRSCMLCHTYRNLKPSTDQREMAQTSTQKAYDALKVAFETLRAEDAGLDKLDKVRAAKVLCLDALDACNSCDKQRPRMKEIFIDIK
jgi:predicted nucleotide-binding protein (sugar kinase/HSP70/actin superfamily)